MRPGEEELLVQAQAGDRDAAEKFLEGYRADLTRVLVKKGSVRPEDAPDVVNMALALAYRALPSFNPEQAKVLTWLGVIAENYYRKEWRVSNRQVQPVTSLDEPVMDEDLYLDPPDTRWYMDPHRSLQFKDIRVHLDQALSRVPEKQREVFVMRFDQGMQPSEIASLMGTSQQNVQRLITACRKKLQRDLHWMVV